MKAESAAACIFGSKGVESLSAPGECLESCGIEARPRIIYRTHHLRAENAAANVDRCRRRSVAVHVAGNVCEHSVYEVFIGNHQTFGTFDGDDTVWVNR